MRLNANNLQVFQLTSIYQVKDYLFPSKILSGSIGGLWLG